MYHGAVDFHLMTELLYVSCWCTCCLLSLPGIRFQVYSQLDYSSPRRVRERSWVGRTAVIQHSSSNKRSNRCPPPPPRFFNIQIWVVGRQLERRCGAILAWYPSMADGGGMVIHSTGSTNVIGNMRRQRLSSLVRGDNNSAASEFSILAREVRNRERLVVGRSTPSHASLQTLTHQPPLHAAPPTSSTTESTWSTGKPTAAGVAAGAKSAVHEVKPQQWSEVSRVSSLQEERRCRRVGDGVPPPVAGIASPSKPRRSRSPNKKGARSRRGGKSTRQQSNGAAIFGHHRGSSTRRTNSSSDANNHENGTHFNQQRCQDELTAFDPVVEAKMLSAFRGNGKTKRGVDVSAIRSLYRERHEREKAKAIDEVRRWWRLGRSEEAPLAKATVAASLLLTSFDAKVAADDTPDAARGLATINREHGYHSASPMGHPETVDDEAFDPKVVGHITSKSSFSPANTPHEKRHDTRTRDHHGGGHEQSRCREFDGLQQYSVDWRQLRQDPYYTAGVVRDIKRALRAGQAVQVRSREDSQHRQEEALVGRTSCSVDCQLMLRTLYMQCVPVSSLCAVNSWCRRAASMPVLHLRLVVRRGAESHVAFTHQTERRNALGSGCMYGIVTVEMMVLTAVVHPSICPSVSFEALM